MPNTFDFYLAGELFDAKHLTGNAHLAAEILDQSDGRFRPVIPQDLEQRSLHPHDIRDDDILALAECDLALFHFDGLELDSGTVVEFMIAKFMDIPAVILRSDFRSSGDQVDHPWNLMASFYPRAEVVLVDALRSYKFSDKPARKGSRDLITDPRRSIDHAVQLTHMIARKVITAFDRVIRIPPLLRDSQEQAVYEWMKTMCGFKRSRSEIEAVLARDCERRRKRFPSIDDSSHEATRR